MSEPTGLDGRIYCADLRPRRTRLLNELKALQGDDTDVEINHSREDELLLEYIADREITEAFNAIKRWYS